MKPKRVIIIAEHGSQGWIVVDEKMKVGTFDENFYTNETEEDFIEVGHVLLIDKRDFKPMVFPDLQFYLN